MGTSKKRYIYTHMCVYLYIYILTSGLFLLMFSGYA